SRLPARYTSVRSSGTQRRFPVPPSAPDSPGIVAWLWLDRMLCPEKNATLDRPRKPCSCRPWIFPRPQIIIGRGAMELRLACRLLGVLGPFPDAKHAFDCRGPRTGRFPAHRSPRDGSRGERRVPHLMALFGSALPDSPRGRLLLLPPARSPSYGSRMRLDACRTRLCDCQAVS